MIFGSFALDDAEGTLLAHTLRVDGRVIKKGSTLHMPDIALLKASGQTTVMAAQLEAGDVTEDFAAAAIAQALKTDAIDVSSAFTGRCNLISKVHGLLVADSEGIQKLNLIDEAITLATLPAHSVVQPGQVIGTVKIIPFAVAKESLQAAEMLAANADLIKLAAFLPLKVGLILTRISAGRESLLDKVSATLAVRLASMDCTVSQELRCAHDREQVAAAIESLHKKDCDLVIICGAAATVDRRDTVPAGIELAGGNVEHFGIPVDPGNLLLKGRRGSLVIIGMPGCARSLSTNGFDWILQRTMAGVSISRTDIAALGVGGLLKEMVNRPMPRDYAVSGNAEPVKLSDTPANFGAIILAAGQSSRMGSVNKLLEPVQGKLMMRHAVDAAIESNVSSVIVVTGFEAERVAEHLSDLPLSIVHNPRYGEGMSTSLQCGIAALPGDVDGVVICLADMPNVSAAHINKLIDAFDPDMDRAVCVSSFAGRRGNPVLWSRFFFAQMQQLSGDEGARRLLREHGDVVYEVDMPSRAVLHDIDTVEALSHFTLDV